MFAYQYITNILDDIRNQRLGKEPEVKEEQRDIELKRKMKREMKITHYQVR